MLRHCFKGRLPSIHGIRYIKTLHTPVFRADISSTQQALLEGIKLLDDILNSTSYNKSLLYTGKYNKMPQLITSQNQIQLQHVIREYLDALQINEANNSKKSFDPIQKLGKIGLQLYMNCHDRNLTPVGTTLTRTLMEQYNRYPEKDTLIGIQSSLDRVRVILKQNRLVLKDENSINALVEKLTHTAEDCHIVKRVMEAVDYNLVSDETVRVMKGRKTFDELEVSKGWKFPAGVLDTDEAYLRSIDLNEKKLIDINEEMIVLVYDGTLRDANKILPTINYASKVEKSLLLMVNGDCLGDALTSITINNNKNKRQANKSKTIIIKYNSKANGDLLLQENSDLMNFLRLPKGLGSVYSPEFSSYVPSKISADLYYGKLESAKATTGESLLYNSNWDVPGSENKFLQSTVTLNVGGHSEIEINQRRAHLDNLINSILCEGLSEGFVPGYGVALAKMVPFIYEFKRNEHNMSVRSALDSVIIALGTPLERALQNVYGYNKFEINEILSKTIQDTQFMSANIEVGSERQNLAEMGVLEPWKRLDKCLFSVLSFIKLLASCRTIITQVFEKPKSSSR